MSTINEELEGFRFVSSMFRRIDAMLLNYVGEAVSSTIAAITPIFSVLLAIWFLFYGVLIIRGAIREPLMDFAWRSLRIALITGIALSAGLYQSEWATPLVKLPTAMTEAFIPTSHRQDTNNPELVGNVVDLAVKKGMDAAKKLLDQTSVWDLNESAGYVLMAIGVLAGTVLLAGVGLAVLLSCQVAVALLAGLGPLFILALLFESTKGFFDRWVAQILSYSFTAVLFITVFGFLASLYAEFAGAIKVDGEMNIIYAFTGLMLLSASSLFLLLKIPTIASGISGGTSVIGSGFGGVATAARLAMPHGIGAAAGLAKRLMRP